MALNVTSSLIKKQTDNCHTNLKINNLTLEK